MIGYDKNQILKYLKETVLPECSRGNRRYLGVLQGVFAYGNEKQLQIKAAVINEEVLSNISVRDLIWLSDHFRAMQWYGYGYAVENWNTDFGREHFGHLSDGQYDALIKLGTFMANGYGRQECMERIGNTQGALPFLILRMNDWVEPIREKAYILVEKRVSECSLYELLLSLPVLEKIEFAGRRNAGRLHSLKDQMGRVIRQRLGLAGQEELSAVFRCDSFVRNAICRFVSQGKVLEREQMERLLSLERAGHGKRLLILGIFRHYGCDREKLEEYLVSKSAIVRFHALLYRYETEHDAWEGLERMLLDPSKRIREYAVYILVKRRGMDVIAYYVQELQRQVSKTVLLGIGENGTKQEIEIVMPFLENADERISKAALIAYGRLAAESGEQVYWRFLSGNSLVLARQAYRLIQAYQIPYSALSLYNGFMQRRGKDTGECFLKLLLSAPSWQGLPYLLQMYCDTGLPDGWRSMILGKMCHRNPYVKISGQQAQEICEILDQCGQRIPQWLNEGIRFDLGYVTKE